MTAESSGAATDFPAAAAQRGRVEPSPRRVRGYLGGQVVFDTTHALYVWEVPYYPQYYVPRADVRDEFLVDDDHPQKVQFGPSRLFSLRTGDALLNGAARVFDANANANANGGGQVAGTFRFDWDSLDWFEEDEPIVGHPRNPYARVDALRSHRQVKIELDGVVLADTVAPVFLFETGLSTRYYIDRTDVVFAHLWLLVSSGRRDPARRPGVDVRLTSTFSL